MPSKQPNARQCQLLWHWLSDLGDLGNLDNVKSFVQVYGFGVPWVVVDMIFKLSNVSPIDGFLNLHIKLAAIHQLITAI